MYIYINLFTLLYMNQFVLLYAELHKEVKQLYVDP